MKIGNTSLKRLTTAETHAFVYAKMECENKGGSIKDRVAFAILDDAEKRGVLKKGGLVVEATSGNTGIGLALACKQRGYRAVIVMPDSMSKERRDLIASYGAEVLLTDGKLGMTGAVEKAKELVASEPNSLLADQFNNPVCSAVHYATTGVEIWEQTDGKADIFVACVGTGGTLTGVGRYLKEKNPSVCVVAVEPTASPLLSKGYAGSHGIQGIGANFIPAVLDRTVYDEVLTVTDEEAIAGAKELKEKEGVWVGISSGAVYAVAKRLSARAENEGKTIVTVFPDHGNRYGNL